MKKTHIVKIKKMDEDTHIWHEKEKDTNNSHTPGARNQTNVVLHSSHIFYCISDIKDISP